MADGEASAPDADATLDEAATNGAEAELAGADDTAHADAAAAAAPKGAVVMICSTIAPKDAKEIGEGLAAQGLLPLDAPVSGGKVGAEAGALTIMASGPKAAFDKASPVSDAVSGTLYKVGDTPGLGATYKVVHQLAAGVHLVAAAEMS